ncbi:MAG: hypothetical protein ACHQUC_00145 [Chlamydiales bacterium]
MLNQFLKVIGLVISSAVLTSCASISDCGEMVLSYVPGVDYFLIENQMNIKISSTKCTNGGTPFYVLVKSADYPTFLTDDYAKIAQFVAYPPDDQSLYGIFCIVPGIDRLIEMEAPPSKCVALYFLFTSPGDVWKRMLELPRDCPTIRIMLDNHQIASVRVD